MKRAKELERDDRNLRLNLGEHVRHVLQGKRLLVFKEMLEDLQFPDKNLFSDIISGFRLSGWMRDSQVFMSLPRPPKLTLEALLKSSLGLQKAVLKRVREPEDAEFYTLPLGKKLKRNASENGSGRTQLVIFTTKSLHIGLV